MAKVFNKRNVLFGFLLVAFIIVSEIVLAHLKLPPWPAFMVMVFFFVVHEDVRLAPNILAGGLAGIICLVLAQMFGDAFGHLIGAEAAKLTFVAVFVYSIVLLKDAIPYVFNSYAFMFFLISALAAKGPDQNPFLWMGIELVGGGIFIGGVLVISRAVNSILKQGAPPSHP